MDELILSNPIFGIMLYIIVMTMIFIIPTTIGIVSSWLIIRFKKMRKTAIIVWTLILFFPLIFSISHDFYMRAKLNAWETMYGYSWRQSLNIATFALPFVLPIWVLGTILLIRTFQKPQISQMKKELVKVERNEEQ